MNKRYSGLIYSISVAFHVLANVKSATLNDKALKMPIGYEMHTNIWRQKKTGMSNPNQRNIFTKRLFHNLVAENWNENWIFVEIHVFLLNLLMGFSFFIQISSTSESVEKWTRKLRLEHFLFLIYVQ